MKLYDGGLIILTILGALAVLYVTVHKISPGLFEDDCLVEELIEEAIENQMGLKEGSIDLTPSSPEKSLPC